MEQKKKQEVFFKKEDNFYKASLSTEELYTEVHGESSSYGTSANDLIKEMMANMMALVSKQGLTLNTLIITDYGCGRSDAANIVGWIINERGKDICQMLQAGNSYEAVLNMLEPWFEIAHKYVNVAELSQVTDYGNVIVQRFDIGVPEFSAPLSQRANIVFCNDVAEHIPYEDIPAFIEDLENAGDYVIMSISLRDAVNYCKLNEDDLLQKAEKVDSLPERCIFLTKDLSGYYIFSLHVSILPKDEWQELLGDKWNLLPAQDYTAVSAVNFEIDEDYSAYKRRLICKEGFVDMIPIPTKPNSRYETDPILFRRTAAIQPHKHVFKLNVLEETFTENEFVAKERQISLAWLKLMEAEIERNDEGQWVLTSIADNYIDRISALDRYSKLAGTDPKVIAERANKYLYNVTGIKL